MNNIKLPLKISGNNIITDFEGTEVAKVLTKTNSIEICEYFAEIINQSTMVLLENEELKNRLKKVEDVIKKMEEINASSEKLIKTLTK